MTNASSTNGMDDVSETQEPPAVTTESSRTVLKTVAGRLSSIETGDLPVIERVGSDGKAGYAVDPTGEMVRPSASQVADGYDAAEAFAAEHLNGASQPPPPPPQQARVAANADPAPPRQGLWARIKAWFSPS
jgi:hypothetical protein